MKQNHLTFLKFTGENSLGIKLALFKCDCGNYKEIIFHRVLYGYTKSCGISCDLMVKHGFARKGAAPKVYYTWQNIKSRCTNKQNEFYNSYGARGIKVCDEWLKSFKIFYNDMGEPPAKNYSIERINNNKGYNKENCRWATKEEQANNKRTSHKLEYEGRIMTVKQWSEDKGIKYGTLLCRLNNYGWSVERSLTTPTLLKWSRHPQKNE
jgi:hypothetical protein